MALYTYLANERPFGVSATCHIDSFDLFFGDADVKVCNVEGETTVNVVEKRTESDMSRDEGHDKLLTRNKESQ